MFCAVFPIENYDFDATLASGQAFRWSIISGAWEGVIGNQWLRLRALNSEVSVETAEPVENWAWFGDFFQLSTDLPTILQTFPRDPVMAAAINRCKGLRLLRQDPWETLASFICSSTKQIVQIQQIVENLCHCFGEPLTVPEGHAPAYSFPKAERIAAASEDALRECKVGFRAPYLKAAAEAVASRKLNLATLAELSCKEGQAELEKLPGVGPKIANCVLLFAYGFQQAFPVDVWIMRALRDLYFPRRKVKPVQIHRFVETHFGPNAGYAQQYLFHYMRLNGRSKPTGRSRATPRAA